MFKIDRNIPPPHKKSKYPFGDMNVGDSILIPYSKYATASVSARNFGKKNGMRFTTRKSEGEARIWRIA